MKYAIKEIQGALWYHWGLYEVHFNECKLIECFNYNYQAFNALEDMLGRRVNVWEDLV